MPRLKSMFLIGLAVAALLSLSLTALYLLFSKDHIEFIRWFLNSIHKPHLQQTASSYLPQQQFFLLRLVAVVFSMGILLLLFIFYKKRTLIITRTQQLTEHVQCLIIGFFKRSIPSGKLNSLLFLLLITFYLVRSIAAILYYPIDFDEADTYLLFSSQGPLVSATFYPLPNNHILFSIITSLSTLLPVDPVLGLRLPLLPAGLLSMFLLFALLKKHFSEQAALMGLSFYIGSYPVFIYSFLARGYLLLLLFYIVAFYAIFQITVEQKSNKRYYYLFAISAVAGFYTIPSFLYAFAGLLLFALPFLWLQKRKHELVCLFKTVVLVFLVVLLLYTPVLISVNWGLLKPYFNPVYQLHETGRAFSNTFTVMAKSFLSPAFFMALLTGIFFIAGSVIYFLKRKTSNRQIVVFVWLQLLLSFAVFFGFKQQFPAKPWMHFVVLSAILLAAVFNLIIKRFGYHRFLLVFTVLFFIISGTIISFNYKNKSTVATGYNSIAKKCEKIMIEKGVKEIYTDIPYFKTMIEYYSIKNHLQTTIYNSRAKSSKFAIFDQYKRYELIITYLNHSKLPSLLYNYDTVLQQNNTVVLLIRQ